MGVRKIVETGETRSAGDRLPAPMRQSADHRVSGWGGVKSMKMIAKKIEWKSFKNGFFVKMKSKIIFVPESMK